MPDIHQSLILVVDDAPSSIRMLIDVLEHSSFRIAIAKNADSALQKAARLLPDLILLDVIMPEIDGFEACQCLKENPKTREIPIIFMTALTDQADKVKGLRLGAVDYITKPIQNGEVLARINVCLSLRRTHLNLINEVAERRQAEQALQAILDELKQAQASLIQAEKMAGLGQIVAGIAHEMNNSVSFMYGNPSHAKDYVQTLLDIVRLYQTHYPTPVDDIQQQLKASDLVALASDLLEIIDSMDTGANRIREIVMSLQTFSCHGDAGVKQADIHAGIDSTIRLLSYQLDTSSTQGHPIQIIRNYGDLPLIECSIEQLNQVFTNIIANAIDALDSRVSKISRESSCRKPGIITISTYLDSPGWVVVTITDNGPGISEAAKDKLFDPFFTTKSVGKGAGLGLSISYDIIVNQHHGSIECFSSPDEGTTFVIKIPVKSLVLQRLSH